MVTSHSIHLTSLSKSIVLCVHNPGEGRTRRPVLTGGRNPTSWPCQDVSRPCLHVGAHVPGQAGSEAPLEWKAALCGAKPQTPESHPSSLVSRAAVALAGSRSSACSAARMCEWLYHADHGKDFGIQWLLLSPCSILGFDLPLAIVSKDRGMSITF